MMFSEKNVLFCTVEDAVTLVEELSGKGLGGLINFVNPHSLMLAQEDPVFCKALECSRCNFADGVGLVIGARLLGLDVGGKCPGPDFMEALLKRSDSNGVEHVFVGGTKGQHVSSVKLLCIRFGVESATEIVPGVFPLTSEELDAIAERITAIGPKFVWVGLGTRKQELTSLELFDRYPNALYLNVGAGFDFLGGRIPRAPIWLRRLNLEWVYRLMGEPARLWYRNWNSIRYLYRVAGLCVSNGRGRS